MYHDCPRFGESRTVVWHPLAEASQFDASQPFKMSAAATSPHLAQRLQPAHRSAFIQPQPHIISLRLSVPHR